MNIIIYGEIKKLFITIPLEARVKVSFPLEFILGSKVEKQIIKKLKELNFKGEIKINEKVFRI